MNIEKLLHKIWFLLLILSLMLLSSLNRNNPSLLNSRLTTAVLPILVSYLLCLSIYLIIPYLPAVKKNSERSFKSWYQRGILFIFLLWPISSYLFFLILQKLVSHHYATVAQQFQSIHFIPLKSTGLLGFASLFIGFYLSSWIQTIWLRYQLRDQFFAYLDYLTTIHKISYWRIELISALIIGIVTTTPVFLSLATYTRFDEETIGISYLGQTTEEQFLYSEIEQIEEYHLMRDSDYGRKYLSYFSIQFSDQSYWESSPVRTTILPEKDQMLLEFVQEKSGLSITQIESIPNSKWESR